MEVGDLIKVLGSLDLKPIYGIIIEELPPYPHPIGLRRYKVFMQGGIIGQYTSAAIRLAS
tara:strand:- start:656 stop:835 length:180 start_codon:yes stop_codon:yes gene_type:complete